MSSEEGSAAVGAADVGGGRMKELVLSNDQSVSQSVFTIKRDGQLKDTMLTNPPSHMTFVLATQFHIYGHVCLA